MTGHPESNLPRWGEEERMIEAIEQLGPRERQIALHVDAWGNCHGDAWFNWF